jgi:hypothetical protein
LLLSPDMGLGMATRAFEFAQPRYDWQALAPRVEDAIIEVMHLNGLHQHAE